MPVQNIWDFLTFIVPGFLMLEIYSSLYPARSRSHFIELTSSIIYSTILYVILFVMYRYNSTIPFSDWFNIGQQDFIDNKILRIVLLIETGVIFGLLIALFRWFKILLLNKCKPANILKDFLYPDPGSIWAKINGNEDKYWAKVFLDDNSIYFGGITDWTYNPDEKEHDFLLSDVERLDEDLNTIYEIEGLGVYLNTRNVVRIEFLSPEENNIQKQDAKKKL